MLIKNSMIFLAIGQLIFLITLEVSEAVPTMVNESIALAENPLNRWKQKLQLFPMRRKPTRVDIRDRLNFLDKNEDEQINQNEDKINIKKEKNKKNDENNENNVKELTISLPQFKTKQNGDWEYAWGRTHGNMWQDTRFNVGGRMTLNRMVIDNEAQVNYFPKYTGDVDTVCIGRSTIYNVPKEKAWLKKMMYDGVRPHRPIWTSLRHQIFSLGNSEECHTPKFVQWRQYMECALRRHQRLEYLIPKYPLHQMAYRKNIYVDRYPKGH
ncbi:uncharacterized protein LOC6562719 isoform X2 [Drosophila grimshawi]|nr:uncharacterized protein LOC6562719 isoform X2 [Drosophila grimshawi]